MAFVTGVVAGARQAIGPYFGLISVLPSVLLVCYIFVLAGSGSWRGDPAWGDGFAALRDLGVGGVAVLGVISVALSVILHPLQFTMVQVLEGYWGTARHAQALRARRIQRHLRRRNALSQLASAAADRIEQSADNLSDTDLVRLTSIRHEAERLFHTYPIEPADVMPTRLGNMLRRYEAAVGRPYGADLPSLAPLLAMVAPPEHMSYVNDQRSALDLAVRTCMVALAATAATWVFLWDNGLSLLIALVPYAATYLSYRGCLVCAEHYGIALGTLLALNRFALYERLHVALPGNAYQEKLLNERLQQSLRHHALPRPRGSLRYVHPEPSGNQEAQTG